jgi:hypothetical protein
MPRPILLVFLLIIVIDCIAQERLSPGKLYDQGEEIVAPRIGFQARIPAGWFGTLPQGEEVFLLLPRGNRQGYMFINAHNAPLHELKERWSRIFSLTETITVSMQGDARLEGNTLEAELEVKGTQIPYKGQAKAVDGGQGFVISFILLAPAEMYGEYSDNFHELASSCTFSSPRKGSVYQDFNWVEFLQQIYLVSWISSAQYKEQNHIWFCPDGTFKTKIKSSGFVREKGPYKGRNKGIWSVEGTGPKGSLTFNFDKKPPLTVHIEIRDDKIFLNGERFYGLENDQCK